MKVLRYRDGGEARIGVLDGDDVAEVGSGDLVPLLESPGLDRLRAAARHAPRRPLAALDLLPPLGRPPAFLAIGLNYAAHVDEASEWQRPDVPLVFNKQITCIAGPYDPIVLPAAAPDHLDYEGELGVVIGTACRNVQTRDAPSVVAGYLVVDDVSVRDWQRASPTMTMGKSWDTHGPIGPWLTTADEVGDPHGLALRTTIDGEIRQDSTTDLMLYDCWELIAYLSTAFTLLPGTVIATGTPSGVGMGMDPPCMLRDGQEVAVEIEGLGRICNRVAAEARAAEGTMG